MKKRVSIVAAGLYLIAVLVLFFSLLFIAGNLNVVLLQLGTSITLLIVFLCMALLFLTIIKLFKKLEN